MLRKLCAWMKMCDSLWAQRGYGRKAMGLILFWHRHFFCRVFLTHLLIHIFVSVINESDWLFALWGHSVKTFVPIVFRKRNIFSWGVAEEAEECHGEIRLKTAKNLLKTCGKMDSQSSSTGREIVSFGHCVMFRLQVTKPQKLLFVFVPFYLFFCPQTITSRQPR